MAAFQAKKGWKRLRKREYKNYHSVTQVGKGREREIIKIIVPFRSYPTRIRKLKKKQPKKFKKLKNTITASFLAKIGCKRLRKREKKNLLFHSVPTQPVTKNSK